MAPHENSLKNLKAPWKPGESGNRQGAVVRLPPELRQARRENMAALIKLIHSYVGMTEEQAKHRLNGPDCLQLEEMVQGQINKAKEGDSRAFQFIIEVMCGKIPEADESTQADTLTVEEKIRLMKQGLAALEAQAGRSSS
jgi:hypothetical protein